MPPEMNQQRDPAPSRTDKDRRLAEAVRAACVEAALRGYEDAMMSGLCREGAWEAAVSAMRMLDVEQAVRNVNVVE